MRPPIEEVGPTVAFDAAFEGGRSVGPAFDQRLPRHLNQLPLSACGRFPLFSARLRALCFIRTTGYHEVQEIPPSGSDENAYEGTVNIGFFRSAIS